MLLQFPLNEQNRALCGLTAGESICYCLPLDLDDAGNFRQNSYTVVTQKRLLVLEEGRRTKEYPLAECEGVRSEPQVGCGLLYVVQAGQEAYIGRFSAKHLTRYSYIARGCLLLRRGETERVESTEYEKTCPVCGRALPGTRECPHCAGKREGFLPVCGKMLAPHKKALAGIFLLMLAATAVTLLTPMFQRRLVDGVLVAQHKDAGMAVLCLGMMALMSVGIVLINALKSYQCDQLGSAISADLRQKLYTKIQMLSLSFVHERTPGALMNRIVRDTAHIHDFMADTFCDSLTTLILFVGVVVLMLALNWRLALVAFLTTPLAVGVSLAVRHGIRSRFHLQDKKSDALNSGLQDVLSGMAVVKSYGQEKREAAAFARNASDFARVQTGNEVYFAIFYPAVTFLLGAGVYLVTYFGGAMTLSGYMTPGALLQFISYVTLFYNYVGWMTNLPRALMRLVASVERVGDVLDQEPAIADAPAARDMTVRGKLAFENASFGYKSYQPVLEKIDLKIRPGEMIGLVGASGTGKSTMINLIMHLYEVDEGRLLVDDTDIKGLKRANYHAQIGVVLQETFLFSGTILNNIRFARPDATAEEIIRAAKMANAHDFICATPDAYNTYVGEHGYNLSGGERQRIAIARAILNDPRLLILDEATASLDTESEYLIQTALNRLTAGRTTVAIAHRLSTLKNADRLVVIDGHSIAEIGTHNELMAKQGIYYGLVEAQREMQGKRAAQA